MPSLARVMPVISLFIASSFLGCGGRVRVTKAQC
jgi:hypothetical protein